MSVLQASQLNAGSRIAYDDGRGRAEATVLTVQYWGMIVQFDDRAENNAIRFGDRKWMEWIELVEI